MYNPIIELLLALLDIYSWVVIVAVVVSWLIAFNVINLHNQIVRQIVRVVDVLTEPVFRQVRRIVPSIGGLDFSPIIVLFAIWFLEYLITWSARRYGLY
ncbi:MAG TPA: YggT family protein [Rhizomicrobium sp.]